MKKTSPTIYKRRCDYRFRCVVRTAAGKAFHIGTNCHDREDAATYAHLLQRDIRRRAEAGDILPPVIRPSSCEPIAAELLPTTFNEQGHVPNPK